VINLIDIDFNNYLFSWITLLSLISATLGCVPYLVAYKIFSIKLFDNAFPLLDKLYLLVFIVEHCHLFHKVCFKSYTREVRSSLRQRIVLLFRWTQDEIFNFYLLVFMLKVVFEFISR